MNDVWQAMSAYEYAEANSIFHGMFEKFLWHSAQVASIFCLTNSHTQFTTAKRWELIGSDEFGKND